MTDEVATDDAARRLATALDRAAAGEPVDDALAEDVLARLSDARTWEAPPAGLRADVLAAVTGSRAASRPGADPEPARSAEEAPRGVVRELPRRRLLWALPLAAAAAALATIVVVGWDGIVPGGGPRSEALGTFPVRVSPDAPPADAAARGRVSLTDEPAGVSIVLDVSGLAPLGPDEYYSAWLKDPATNIRVPVGSFHARQLGAPIALWSGVSPERFTLFTVTKQSANAGPDSGSVPVVQAEVR